MEQKEILRSLRDLKEKVTELGHAHLQNKLPIELSRINDETEPFVILEQSFDEAISKFEYNAARVWEKK